MSHTSERGAHATSSSVAVPKAPEQATALGVTVQASPTQGDAQSVRSGTSPNLMNSTSSSPRQSISDSQSQAILPAGSFAQDKSSLAESTANGTYSSDLVISEKAATAPHGERLIEATNTKGVSTERNPSKLAMSDTEGSGALASPRQSSPSSVVFVEAPGPIKEAHPVVEMTNTVPPKGTASPASTTQELDPAQARRPRPGLITPAADEVTFPDTRRSEERRQERFQCIPAEVEPLNGRLNPEMQPNPQTTNSRTRDKIRRKLYPASWVRWPRNHKWNEIPQLQRPRTRDYVRSKLLRESLLRILIGRRPTAVVKPIVDKAAIGLRSPLGEAEIRYEALKRPLLANRHERAQEYHTAKADLHAMLESHAENNNFVEARKHHAEMALHHSRQALKYTHRIGRTIENRAKGKFLDTESLYNTKTGPSHLSPLPDKVNMEAEDHLREARRHLERKLESSWRHMEIEQEKLSQGLQNRVWSLEDKLSRTKQLDYRVLSGPDGHFNENDSGKSRIRRGKERLWSYHAAHRHYPLRLTEHNDGNGRLLHLFHHGEPNRSTVERSMDANRVANSHF